MTPAFDRGGLEQVVLNLYWGYRAAGYDCLVLVETDEVGEAAARAAPEDVVCFGGDERRFTQALAERRPGALHFHHSTFGLRQAAALGLFSVYTLHSVYSWMSDGEFEARAAEVACAARVVAVSGFARRYFLQRCRVELDIAVIANGVDLEGLETGARPVTRSDLGVPEDAFVFVTPAGLFPAKHQMAAIGALERLDGGAHLLLIGREVNVDYAACVRRRRAASPAGERISIRDALPRDQMRALYQLADAVLLPSLQEGSSNVVQETLLYDRPMVLTDVGDAREAASMSDRVLVVPRAYGDLLDLTPSKLHELSRDSEPPNVAALAAAMRSLMAAERAPACEAELTGRRESLSSRRMVEAYLELFDGAPLLFQRPVSA